MPLVLQRVQVLFLWWPLLATWLSQPLPISPLTASSVLSVLSCPGFNIVMAKDRVEWKMGSMEQKHNSLLYNCSLSLSNTQLAPEYGWAESDEKDMWWNAGNLITGSLPTETQPAYLLFQGTSNVHWLSWFLPGAFNKLLCPAEIRSWEARLCICFSSLENRSLFSSPHCTQAYWSLSHSWVVIWMLFNASHNNVFLDSILEA